jgi:hypothetical protein
VHNARGSFLTVFLKNDARDQLLVPILQAIQRLLHIADEDYPVLKRGRGVTRHFRAEKFPANERRQTSSLQGKISDSAAARPLCDSGTSTNPDSDPEDHPPVGIRLEHSAAPQSCALAGPARVRTPQIL